MDTGPKKIGSGLGFASKIGTQMVVSVLIGAYGGHFLDGYLGSDPWLLVLGLIFGGAAGFLSMYRTFQELEDNNDKENLSNSR